MTTRRTWYSPPAGERTVSALPSASWALRASPSVSAEAIQTASRCDARPVRAVTSPPVPRLTLPSSWKVTGPRLETRTSGPRESDITWTLRQQLGEDPQVVAQITRREEVLAHVLLAAPPQRLAERG